MASHGICSELVFKFCLAKDQESPIRMQHADMHLLMELAGTVVRR